MLDLGVFGELSIPVHPIVMLRGMGYILCVCLFMSNHWKGGSTSPHTMHTAILYTMDFGIPVYADVFEDNLEL